MIPIQFKSYADLYRDVMAWSRDLPRFDCVVGVPRSGMLPATMLGKIWDVPVLTTDAFLEDWGCDRDLIQESMGRGGVFVVDDSYGTGKTLGEFRDRISASGWEGLVYGAVYSAPGATGLDYSYQTIQLPRLFEWNMFEHGHILKHSAWDIDGLLCPDPTLEQNDDGPKYEAFIRDAPLWIKPGGHVACIITARLEKYRAATVEWLTRKGIGYGELVMALYPNKVERAKIRGVHARDKAYAYAARDLSLFYESEMAQAETIRDMTGKAVYCTSGATMFKAFEE